MKVYHLVNSPEYKVKVDVSRIDLRKREKIIDWLTDNDIDSKYILENVYLKTEQDATLFMLKWS